MQQIIRIALIAICLDEIGGASEPHVAPPPNDAGFATRVQPLNPDDALEVFELPAGYSIQRTAEEPLVTDPVAMAFDENGNLYVVEMRDYSEQDQECLGRIRLLEDIDQDGHFDKSTIFADGLSWPTALICYDGGIFVGAAPDILFLKDTNGDHVADEQHVVFTGFGRSNVQGLMNSFRWGPDNRIHGATSTSGGLVNRPGQADELRVNLRGRDFSFDPRTLEIRPESGGGQHGMCFDDWGRKFVCSNSQHAQLIAYEDHYLSRNPDLSAAPAIIEIAVEGGQAAVFRSSPIEKWRIARTQMRVAGEVSGPIEGGGQPAGYFTGATGITIYRGDALGEDMHGVAVVADVGSNLVHRKRLTANGVLFSATRIDPQSEFLRSADLWFRPVQFANAPDGCLHVLDMYREVIEHPKSIPPSIKQHLDLTSGRNRGRLYRVTPDNYVHSPTPQLGSMSSVDLVKLLSHPNSWHRETASRLLFERQDLSVVPLLRRLVTTGRVPLGRLHALSVLQGMDALDEQTLVRALADVHPRIRERALKSAEAYPDSPEIIAAVGQLVTDEDPRVRYQLAFSAGEFPAAVKLDWICLLFSSDGDDKWMRLALNSSLSDIKLPVLSRLAFGEDTEDFPGKRIVLRSLVQQIAQQKQASQIDELLTKLNSLTAANSPLKQELLSVLLEAGGDAVATQVSGGTWAPLLTSVLEEARNELQSKGSTTSRIQAIRTMKFSSNPADMARLVSLLNPNESGEIQSEALTALAASPAVGVVETLLDHWQEFPPSLRLQAEEVLFSRNERIAVLLNRIETGKLSATALSPARFQAIAKNSNSELKSRAERIWNSADNATRAEVVNNYASSLKRTGDIEAGRIVFRKNCISCHKLEGHGHELGPNLATIRNRGKEAILLNILDPNREVNPLYLNYQVALMSGQVHTGMIHSETATSLTLLRAENRQETLLRKEIDQIQCSNQSLMPEGLEKQINEQDMADLLSYLLLN